MALLTSAAIGLGSSLISSAFGSIFGNNSAKKQYEYQRKLNQEAFQHDIDMWNRQNAYNTPSAQMERLQAAGLNPNLVYGNGGASNTASGAPTYNAGHAPDVASARQAASSMAAQGFQTGLNMQLQQAQIHNIEADTLLKGSQEQYTSTQKEISMIDKYIKENTSNDNIRYTLEKWKQDLILGRNQIKLGDSQITLNQKQMEKLDAETGYVIANTKLTQLQAEEISINIQYLPELLRSQISSNNANAFNAIQHGELAKKQSVLTEYQSFTEFARGNLVRSDADIKEIEHYIASQTIEDVIRSKKFQSLEREQQFYILRDFTTWKAAREAFGADGALLGLGTIATSAAVNLTSALDKGIKHSQVSK